MEPVALPDERDLLVEADALLEKGDPRGELIIVQCELERGGFDRARGIALRKRERELITAHGREWAPDDPIVHDPILRKGVVIGGSVDARTFVEHEAEIASCDPHFRHLRLGGLTFQTGHWGTTPPANLDAEPVRALLERVLASGRITSLDLEEAAIVWMTQYGLSHVPQSANVVDDVVAWLVESGRLARFTGFRIKQPSEETFASVLAQKPAFEDLGFSKFALLATAIDAIANTKQRPKTLVFEPSWRSDETFIEVLRAPFFEKVVDLTTGFAPRILAAAELPALRVLRFTQSGGVNRTSIRALLGSPLGKQLEAIELRGGQEGHEPALRRKDWDGVLLHWIRE